MPKSDRHISLLEDATEETVNPGDSANQAVRVNLVAGGASAGTQYTEGDTDSSITGTAAMWEDSGDTLRPVSTTHRLPVNAAGDVAHDGIDSGNPLKVGAKAIAHGTNPTAVAAADRTDLYANRHGVLFTMGGHPNALTLRANYDAAQTDTAIVTVGAGAKIAVTRLTVCADNANTADVSVVIGFAAANTPTTTGVVGAHPGIDAGSGFTFGNGGGILGVGADGEDLRITSSAPTDGSIDVIVTYFTIES